LVTLHLLALGGILRRALPGVPWKASPTLPRYHTAHSPRRLANSGGKRSRYTDLWDPDSTGRGAAHGSGKKEWNLLVVNDKKVVNAMAAPGVLSN